MTTTTRALTLQTLAAAIAALLIAWPSLAGSGASQAQTPSLAIDAGVGGNEPASPGERHDCVSAPRGEQFQVDVIVEGVTDLLAWELVFAYDPAVVVVVEHDVKLFQAANAGSSVIDISAAVPNDSGFHALSAFDSSDPPAVDSGSGVLARVTLEAVGAGESTIGFGERDLNRDGVQDRGTVLKNFDADPIGDEDGDQFFDGAQVDALAVIGGDCPPGTNAVVITSASSGGGDSVWLFVALGAAVIVALAALGGFALYRRR